MLKFIFLTSPTVCWCEIFYFSHHRLSGDVKIDIYTSPTVWWCENLYFSHHRPSGEVKINHFTFLLVQSVFHITDRLVMWKLIFFTSPTVWWCEDWYLSHHQPTDDVKIDIFHITDRLMMWKFIFLTSPTVLWCENQSFHFSVSPSHALHTNRCLDLHTYLFGLTSPPDLWKWIFVKTIIHNFKNIFGWGGEDEGFVEIVPGVFRAIIASISRLHTQFKIIWTVFYYRCPEFTIKWVNKLNWYF